MSSIEKTDDTPMFPKKLPPPLLKQQPPSADSSDADDSHDEFADNSMRTERSEMNQLSKSKYGSKGALHSPIGSTHSFDLQVRFFNVLSNFQVIFLCSIFCFCFFVSITFFVFLLCVAYLCAPVHFCYHFVFSSIYSYTISLRKISIYRRLL